MRVGLAGAAMLALASCVAPPPGELDPRRALAVEVVRPGFEWTLTRADVREALARAHLESDRDAPELEPEAKRAVLEALIDARLAEEAIEAAGIETSTRAVAEELERTRRDLALAPHTLEGALRTEADLAAAIEARLAWAALVAENVVDTSTPSDDGLRSRWAAESPRRERVHAGQIVLQTEEEARAVAKALAAGEDFRALARARSIAPEASRGGDLGWFERGDMPHALEDACFSLDPGATSPVVASTYGYHLFRVYARAPAGAQPFAEARPRLIREVRMERRAAAERGLQRKLRDAVEVRYVADVLRPLGIPLTAEEIENR